ncbi:TonB family protein [bacterium SCSIO 12696]|nr:TonB family protein [bacterium SCSIO 12696]
MLLSHSSSIRPLKALLSAIIATFVLLLFMAALVASDVKPVAEVPTYEIPIFQPKVEIDNKYKTRITPVIPKPKPIATPSTDLPNDQQLQISPITLQAKSINESDYLTGIDAIPGGSTALFSSQGDRMVSLERATSPKYPTNQASRGTEGYVDIIFDVTPEGTTTNLRVLAAEPQRVFNRSAINAVKQWKYRPQMVNGKAVTTTGVVARVRFELEK